MQRQRGELVPIGEVVADLDGPVQAIRKTPPPGFYGANDGAQEFRPRPQWPPSSLVCASVPAFGETQHLQDSLLRRR